MKAQPVKVLKQTGIAICVANLFMVFGIEFAGVAVALPLAQGIAVAGKLLAIPDQPRVK